MITTQKSVIGLVAFGLLSASALLAARVNRDFLTPEAIAVPTANAALVKTVNPQIPAVPSELKALRESDGLFYVTAHVNGQPLRFLVDTGASVVVLTGADARAIGLNLNDKHYNSSVQTVGGNTDMAWTTLDHVKIAGRDVQNLKAAVVKTGLGVSLLGQNALVQLGSVTIEGDHIRMR
ncbi:TIGR02281 family clan AA aspartic protease [Sphingobium phenoxybenzoativorans]|uniref:TIGR02281 family clan AA aspartic protease n=1 Tax=Sphingobium phenoxybenzoativorans TaxID=1592790 RepID=A0A975K8Z6_9SPHN|nr:TIGR02281 family clan AA aspartic protease [Sphingobium phenoxybenzoativorans]QUT05647.1 TIGR02281 family clan AA aspartic protease [Sphingobium phenoxybenzoativorans]